MRKLTQSHKVWKVKETCWLNLNKTPEKYFCPWSKIHTILLVKIPEKQQLFFSQHLKHKHLVSFCEKLTKGLIKLILKGDWPAWNRAFQTKKNKSLLRNKCVHFEKKTSLCELLVFHRFLGFFQENIFAYTVQTYPKITHKNMSPYFCQYRKRIPVVLLSAKKRENKLKIFFKKIFN